MVRDVDVKYVECLKLGCRVEQEIGDRKFVFRDFVVRDPDGWGVRFRSFLRAEAGRSRRGQTMRSLLKEDEIEYDRDGICS